MVSSTKTAVTSKLTPKLQFLPRVTRFRSFQLHGSLPRILLAKTHTKTSGRQYLIVEVHLRVPRSHNMKSRTLNGQLMIKVLSNRRYPAPKAIMNTILVRQFQQINLHSRVHRAAFPVAIVTRRNRALHSDLQPFWPHLSTRWKYLIRAPTRHHRSMPVQLARVCTLGITLEKDELQRRWKWTMRLRMVNPQREKSTMILARSRICLGLKTSRRLKKIGITAKA